MKHGFKKTNDVSTLKGDFVRLKMPNGSMSLVDKYQALRYANEALMELYIEEANDLPVAEMRRPRSKGLRNRKS